MNAYMILIVLGFAGYAIASRRRPDLFPGMAPGRRSTRAEKEANLRSQLQTAFADGDNARVVKIQKELEMLDLEID